MEARNKTRTIEEILQNITTIASVIVSLLWLLYAAINRSGHTSINPFLIMQIQLVPTVVFIVSAAIMKDPFSSKAIRVLSIAVVFGLAIPVVLEMFGVLQEYNRWCKSGLSEPSWIKTYAYIIVLGTGLVITMKRAMKQLINSTISDNKSLACRSKVHQSGGDLEKA